MNDFVKYAKFLNLARQRAKQEGIELPQALEKLKFFANQPYTYIHFTNDSKLIGINPKTQYSTPAGIYGYPLTSEILSKINKNWFAADRPNLIIFKLKNENSILDLGSYSEQDFVNDIISLFKNRNLSDNDIDEALTNAKRHAKQPNEPGSKLFYILHHLSGGKEVRPATGAALFNKAFRYLGYSGVNDPGKGIIHPNEPKQGFALGSGDIEIIDIIENPFNQEKEILLAQTSKIPEIQLKLVEKGDQYVLYNLARNQNITTEIQLKLLEKGGQGVLCNLATNPNITTEIQLKLLEKNDRYVLGYLAGNPNITPEIQLKLLEKDDLIVLYNLATNSKITPEVQLKLVEKDDQSVLGYLVLNPNITPEIQLKIVEKGDRYVLGYLAYNPNITPEAKELIKIKGKFAQNNHILIEKTANINIDRAYKNGQLNDYFFNQLNKNLKLMPEYLHSTLLEEAKAMSLVGVDNVEDQKIFLFISMHVADILNINRKPSAEETAKISAIVYRNRNKEGRTINTLMNLFNAVNKAADELSLKKLAYPQGYNGKRQDTPYNIEKWIQATRDIYSRANQTGDLAESFAEITGNWNKMEKLDYQAWLRFHQEGAQYKYKTAQYYDNNDAGYILPNPLDYDLLKAKVPHPLDSSEERPRPKKQSVDVNDARTRIEQQRSKIIGRLNAAEKLLSSLDGQFFAGDDQEYMLKLLQDLKRKVQTSNKLSVKSTLFEDFIHKTANMLKETGKVKAGRFFYKIAQTAEEELLPLPPEGEMASEVPMSDAPIDDGSKEQTLAAIKEFFKRLETGVSDFDYADDEVRLEASLNPYDIVVEAQEIPPTPPPAQALAPSPALEHEEKPLEVSEDEMKEGEGPQVDDAIDAALQNITIKDIIDNLEMLASFYKKREMSRQLSFVDIMMDRLGIGSFFPEMGEAMSKGLEANQYIGTRIETVLSRLRGVIDHPGAEQMMKERPEPAETAQLRGALEQEKRREEDRKQRRKEREEAKEQQPTAGEQLAAQQPTQPQIPQAQPLR